MKVFLFLVFLLLFSSLQSNSQRITYGVFGTFDFNIHRCNFQKLPGYPNCCPNFESGKGYGYSFGLEFSNEIFSNYFLSLRIGFIDFS
ncbi:MAG: hypothetical protein N2560_10520 [Ignavibacteria bacterium]|nr:hypothetical protein [Ignavibacteria bacterium]